jgi:LCP family protein required for cell wall assembly
VLANARDKRERSHPGIRRCRRADRCPAGQAAWPLDQGGNEMSDDPGSNEQPSLGQPSHEQLSRERSGHEQPGPGGAEPRRRSRRKRRVLRIAMASAISVVLLAAAAAVSGYALVNHLTGNIHRIPDVFVGLDAARQPVMPASTRRSMTILLTGSEKVPAHIGGGGVDHSSTFPEGQSGLIALVHINANRRAGAIVHIPPHALVHIPGHGVTQLWHALPFGGPSLLIRTVEQLTDVRIDHYSVVDFGDLIATLGPLGGVDVTLPETTSSNGVVFHKGINHLNGITALAYVRQTSLSEEGRVLRQQALLRAIMQKLAQLHLITNPTGDFSVLDAFTKALSVDSNFTNSALEELALHLHLLGARSGTFVSAPVARTLTFEGQTAAILNRHISRKLWHAIRHDSVAAFALRYPFTVTPNAPQ